MKKLPGWIKNDIANARRILGVEPAFRIFARTTDKPAGSRMALGSANVCTRYLNAEIEFDEELRHDTEGTQVIYHEVMHVTFAELDDLMCEMISKLPESEREGYTKRGVDAMERFIQRTTRGIVAELEKNDEG